MAVEEAEAAAAAVGGKARRSRCATTSGALSRAAARREVALRVAVALAVRVASRGMATRGGRAANLPVASSGGDRARRPSCA